MTSEFCDLYVKDFKSAYFTAEVSKCSLINTIEMRFFKLMALELELK